MIEIAGLAVGDTGVAVVVDELLQAQNPIENNVSQTNDPIFKCLMKFSVRR